MNENRTAATVSLLLPGEPLPVQLMNTIWADGHGVHDALTSTAELARWLEATRLAAARPKVNSEDLENARRMRDALRRLAAARTGDPRAAAASALDDLELAAWIVNEAARTAPPRITLEVHQGELRRRSTPPAADSTSALAQAAAGAIDLLTRTGDDELRACLAPRCVLYFVKDHPRREWCSTACGNRARAARHYRRHRGDSTT